MPRKLVIQFIFPASIPQLLLLKEGLTPPDRPYRNGKFRVYRDTLVEMRRDSHNAPVISRNLHDNNLLTRRLRKIVMKYFFSGLLLLLLAGCSQQPPQPVQKAQRARITPQITLNMEQLCRIRRQNATARGPVWWTSATSSSSGELRAVGSDIAE